MYRIVFLSALLTQIVLGYTNISNAELEELVSNGAIIIDVRLEEEWLDSGVIPNSKTITYFDKNARPMMREFLSSANKALANDKSKPVVVVCRSGSRSMTASEALEKAGYRQVFNLKYGILGWKYDRKKLQKYQK